MDFSSYVPEGYKMYLGHFSSIVERGKKCAKAQLRAEQIASLAVCVASVALAALALIAFISQPAVLPILVLPFCAALAIFGHDHYRISQNVETYMNKNLFSRGAALVSDEQFENTFLKNTSLVTKWLHSVATAD